MTTVTGPPTRDNSSTGSLIRCSEDDGSRGGDGRADEGEDSHRNRQPQCLAQDLIALGLGVTREIGNRQRHRAPKSHRRCQACAKYGRDIRTTTLARRVLQHRSQPADVLPGPNEQEPSDHHEEWAAPGLQPFDRLHSSESDPQVDGPEQHETEELSGADPDPTGKHVWQRRNTGPHYFQQLEDGEPADPGLNTKPAAGDDRSEDGRDVGTEESERRARQNGKGDAVSSAGVGNQGDRNEDDQITQYHRPYRRLPCPAAVDQARRQGVGRDGDGHAHPQRGDVPHVPGTLVRRDRQQVFVAERWIV